MEKKKKKKKKKNWLLSKGLVFLFIFCTRSTAVSLKDIGTPTLFKYNS
jgi:hypothetical protein